jgi:hypothetical protein
VNHLTSPFRQAKNTDLERVASHAVNSHQLQSTEARQNVAAGAADATRAMLLTSCRNAALLTAIFAFL